MNNTWVLKNEAVGQEVKNTLRVKKKCHTYRGFEDRDARK
jgi:hypothetical protein